MRYSNTSVEQFHLGRLVDGIAQGRIGIPEFQRDFDWNENDVRSLLSTVFAGWPAGSLLLLEGKSELFALRPMDAAPKLHNVSFGVLDGQQRLTSLYQALYGVGETLFGVKWDIALDQDIEEGIVSVRRSLWDRHFSTIEQQVERRLIPLSALKSPTAFFAWRDDAVATVQDVDRRNIIKQAITSLYTYRLSSIHDYEFPVVKLDRDIEPSAISRIFEKVNKTGLTLNTFDLLVAKSFDTGWNLRDRWLNAREKYSSLSTFFADDGLPLLQAISLLKRHDLRQAAVLELSKQDVQLEWDKVVESSVRIIKFLRQKCGVLRREFMPYLNLLPPLIALEAQGKVTANPSMFENWFWSAGFSGAYEVGANTRLVAHYRAVRDNGAVDLSPDDVRVISFEGATRKSQKALWSVVSCAYVKAVELRLGRPVLDEHVFEIDSSTLFSMQEVGSSDGLWDDQPEIEFRSCLNTFLVPKRISSVVKKLDAAESLELCRLSEFDAIASAQLPDLAEMHIDDWFKFKTARIEWLVDFMKKEHVTGLSIVVRKSPDELYDFIEL